jgi:hypothetical protein
MVGVPVCRFPPRTSQCANPRNGLAVALCPLLLASACCSLPLSIRPLINKSSILVALGHRLKHSPPHSSTSVPAAAAAAPPLLQSHSAAARLSSEAHSKRLAACFYAQSSPCARLSRSTSDRQAFRWVTPAGSSTAWSMVRPQRRHSRLRVAFPCLPF